jgi:hypothetical protein
MMKCVSFGLALLGLVQAERAHLIVEKSFVDPPVVEGRDINITLSLTNVGDTPATDVVLSDKVRAPQFTVTAGEPVTKFDSIAGGETVEHTYTVAAVKKGLTRVDRAVVNYKFTNDAGEEQSAKGMSTTIFVDRMNGGLPVMDANSINGGALESGVFRVFTEEEEGTTIDRVGIHDRETTIHAIHKDRC